MVIAEEKTDENLSNSCVKVDRQSNESNFSGNLDQDDVLLTALVDKEEKDSDCQMTIFTGKITQLFCEHGLIDGEVYFSAESVVGSNPLHVGDTVNVVARQQNKDGGWMAESVSLVVSSWEDDDLTSEAVTGEVGKVTELKEEEGIINKNIIFTIGECVEGYLPHVGDWVSVELDTADSDTSGAQEEKEDFTTHLKEPLFNASKVAPLRTWSFKGCVSASLPDHGYIDEEVFFRLDACLNGYRPHARYAGETKLLYVQKLRRDNYIERMSTLLHLEEIQMEINILEFDLYRVCLQAAGEFLTLHVPGLAEGRPSLLIGDSVILLSPVDPDEPQYEGIIHEIYSDKVLLKFNSEFHSCYNGEDYNVTFRFNRVSLRRCHQACRLAATMLGDQVLFPSQEKLNPPQVELFSSPHTASTPLNSNHHIPHINPAIQDKIQFYNSLLNDQQKTAVIQVLLGQCRPLPYIIFGPPGTGKTITVVEAILQIFTHMPRSRIIACTPSNSAADLLVERLHMSGIIKNSDMVRLNAFQRSNTGISDIVLPYCCTGEQLDIISHYRIIVATCNTAGLLCTAGLKTGHFTHVFVDEAGQATEPECLIPAGLVAGGGGQIVLAGDPKQLGPVLLSPFAKVYGLELSFLERLMEHLPYQHNAELYADHGGYNPLLVTMLIDNYRCHPAILALPSKLFYHGYLRECASAELTDTLKDWFMLPRPGVPVIFHGIETKDMRDEDSPSWFNPGEVLQVIQYLQGLLGNKAPLHPDNIGIITPYRKQVEKIRLYMDILGITQVKVGSVEEFQGQERQAIIVSTVRSNDRLVNSDVRHVLGFVSNPKRFNVAITRAQALLIVVGNPYVLSLDKNWHYFIQACVENGSYTGCELPEVFLGTNLAQEQTENTL
ncbi:hypothetical protein C0Q70_15471 [Pomacea canaliculata]|uniref:RNA helicase n=1 Tax=Pomacea canaliculata TaxID=400727 RepID=A0A2T7NUY9_POMCA|nr:hypothetical protein C0Q70_15471 [Pomacea canaliculata]